MHADRSHLPKQTNFPELLETDEQVTAGGNVD